EALAVLGEVDRIRRGAEDRHSGAVERHGQIERSLAAKLDDHAIRFLALHDLEHVLERERLEVEPVAGVVVGRNRFGIAVDHDALDALALQRERGMAAAIVELYPLTDWVAHVDGERKRQALPRVRPIP